MIRVPATAKTGRIAALLAVALPLLATVWQLATAGDAEQIGWLAMTVVCLIGGYAALGWLRPARWA